MPSMESLIKISERLHGHSLKPFLVGLISSSGIWILFIFLLSSNQQQSCTLPGFIADNSGIDENTNSVRSLVQTMFKIVQDIGKAYRQRSFKRMKYGLHVLFEDLTSALDSYSEEVSGLAHALAQQKNEEFALYGSARMDVCSEVYSNRRRDFPLFRYGWKSENCTQRKPLHKLLTFAINFVGASPHFVLTRGSNLLKSIAERYPGITVMIATEDTLPKKLEMIDLNFVSIILSERESSEIIPNFADACSTPYVFMAQNLTYFDGRDENLERLIRQISFTGVDIAGGSFRDKDGHWKMGCQQMYLEAFDLRFKAGYEFSQNSCLLCDSVDGPFVVRTEWLKQVQFDINLHENVQLVDIFINRTLRMQPSFVCPDVMFYVDANLQDMMKDREFLLPLAKKHEITYMRLADGTSHKFGSSEILDGCQNSKRQTLMRPKCCIDNLFNAIKRVLKICNKFGAQCEISEGTLLGALKFNGVLPWEKDADIIVRLTNTTLPEFGRALANKEYKVECRRGLESMCLLHTKYWVVEVRLVEFLDSQELTELHLARTKILFGDIWAPTARNPGFNVRNRYGHEIYRHADHWSVVGHHNSWIPYNPGKWVKCKFPGHRACLDQYSADGNLHFDTPNVSPMKKKKKKKKAKQDKEDGKDDHDNDPDHQHDDEHEHEHEHEHENENIHEQEIGFNKDVKDLLKPEAPHQDPLAPWPDSAEERTLRPRRKRVKKKKKKKNPMK